jgi:RHS repeat-associated protein
LASPCNNGNLISQAITVPGFAGTQSYDYDALNRLHYAAEDSTFDWREQYGYDAYGNRWVDLDPNPPTTYGLEVSDLTPQGSDWFTAKNRVENPNPGHSGDFDYDDAGNQTVVNGISFGYDSENRLRSFTVAGLVREVYDYDGVGNRVRHQHQTWNGSTWSTASSTLYVYDARGQLAAEYGAQSASSPCVTCYMTTDTLGSTRLMTDENGVAKVRYDYLPFGQEILPPSSGGRASVMCGSISCYSQSSAVNQKFTGKERDAETGLDYFGARYLSSAEGRFISADWSARPQPVPYADFKDPQTLNLYGYVRNNPLSRVDRDGHDDCTYDETGKGSCIKRSFWHNLLVGNTYKLNDNGTNYNLSEPLKALQGGEKYRIVGSSETGKLMNSFLASQSPTAPGQKLSYGEIKERATDPRQWNWKMELNKDFGAHALFVLNGTAQRSDYLGNVGFGYLMNAWGHSGVEAKVGGSVFNLYDSFQTGASAFKGNIDTLYDDPRDWEAIDFGTSLYETQH